MPTDQAVPCTGVDVVAHCDDPGRTVLRIPLPKATTLFPPIQELFTNAVTCSLTSPISPPPPYITYPHDHVLTLSAWC
jgi:hypothetical protein